MPSVTAGRSVCWSTSSSLYTMPFRPGWAPPLMPLSIQYADFAYWQRHWQSHPKGVAQLAYWREQLRDPLPVLPFATARPRQTIDGLHPARRELALPASLLEDAKRFSQQ